MVGGGITKGTLQVSNDPSNNYQTISGLDTTKWYAVYGYQYVPYSNYHATWTEEQLKAINGVGDAMLLGSYGETNYCTTAALMKFSSSSISASLGYQVIYFTIN